MKKSIFLLLTIMVLMLAGCSKKEQMTNFIPTPVPGEGTEELPSPTSQADDAEVTQAPETVYVGQTTPMYVKMSEYDDILNVRSKPSTDSEAVGFLVHTEKIDVIEIVDGWASFLYKDAICYVNADYLVKEKPDYIDPPTPTKAPNNSTTQTTDADGPQI